MQIGIIGKPNVGKSTFFNAATLASAECANYPFTTIKPNHAIGFVRVKCPEDFFNVKCTPQHGYCISGNRFVGVDLIDVAGLVQDAHKGKGLGNQFLDDLRQANVFIHVIDISGSTNENGETVKPLSHDPAEDIKFIEREVDMWIYSILKKNKEKITKMIQTQGLLLGNVIETAFSSLGIKESEVNSSANACGLEPEKFGSWNDEEIMNFSTTVRKKSKKMIIAANKIDVEGSEKNLEKIKNEFGYIVIPTSSESELALKRAHKAGIINYIPGNDKFEIIKKDISVQQREALRFIEKFLEKFNSTGVQDVINTAVFDLMNYIPVFPVSNSKLQDALGHTLPDALLMPYGSTPLDLAGAIHTNIAQHFISAIDMKTKKNIGRDSVMKSGDVIQILHNA